MLLENQYFYQVHYSNERDPFGQSHIRYMNDTIHLLKGCKLKPDTPRLSGSMPCCIMFGVGLGYALEHLYSSIEVANLILIEPDNDVFFASLHTIEWAPLIEFLQQNRYGLYLMLGEDKENLYNDLGDFYDRHGRFQAGFFWNFVHYRWAVNAFKAYADSCVEQELPVPQAGKYDPQNPAIFLKPKTALKFLLNNALLHTGLERKEIAERIGGDFTASTLTRMLSLKEKYPFDRYITVLEHLDAELEIYCETEDK